MDLALNLGSSLLLAVDAPVSQFPYLKYGDDTNLSMFPLGLVRYRRVRETGKECSCVL